MQLYATCICIIFMLLSPSWPFPALHHTYVAHINPHHPGHPGHHRISTLLFFSWGYQWYSPNPTHVWANLAPFLTSPTAVSFASASCHHDHRPPAQVGSAAPASDARRTPRPRPGLMGPRGPAHRWRAVGGVFSQFQEELASRVPGLLPGGSLVGWWKVGGGGVGRFFSLEANKKLKIGLLIATPKGNRFIFQAFSFRGWFSFRQRIPYRNH